MNIYRIAEEFPRWYNDFLKISHEKVKNNHGKNSNNVTFWRNVQFMDKAN